MADAKRIIRVLAKAIIISEGRILLLRNRDDLGDWYLLPDGGQNHGESLVDALQRECREEIGTNIKVGPLHLVREYIGQNHEFAATDSDAHQVELMFDCQVPANYMPRNGSGPDSMQVGVEWVALANLAELRIYPSGLAAALARKDALPVYMGDVN